MATEQTQIDARNPAAEKWLTQGMRVTSFLPAKVEVSASGWWRAVVGSDPEAQTARPKLQIETYDGPFDQWQLQLSIQPGRVDWRLMPPHKDGLDMDPLSALGAFPTAARALLDLVKRWASVENCPRSTRLAMGAELFQRVDDKERGYQLIAEYLRRSVVVDPKESSDLLYRINRKRTLDLGEMNVPINRLSTWDILHFAGEASMLMPKREPTTILSLDMYALRLQLDINTAPEFVNDVEPGHFGDVLGALVALGEEIAAEGDIP